MLENANINATNPAPATTNPAPTVGGITRAHKPAKPTAEELAKNHAKLIAENPAPAGIENKAAINERHRREAAAEERRRKEREAEEREAEKRRAADEKYAAEAAAEKRRAKNEPKPKPWALDIDRAAAEAENAREAAAEAAAALEKLLKRAAEKPAEITHTAALDEAKSAADKAKSAAAEARAAHKVAAEIATQTKVKGGKANTIKSAADKAAAEAAAARAALDEVNKAAARAVADYTAAEQREHIVTRLTANYNGKQSSREIWHDFAAENFAVIPNRKIFILGLGEERGKAYYNRVLGVFADFIALLSVYSVARHEAAVNKSNKAAAAALKSADKNAFVAFRGIIDLLHLTNGENIGYNADVINVLTDKAYNFAYKNKKQINEGYTRAYIAPQSMITITLKTLCSADTIKAAAEAAADKAAKRKADKAARAAKNAAAAAALEKSVNEAAPEVNEAEKLLNSIINGSKSAEKPAPEKPAPEKPAPEKPAPEKPE